MPFRENVPRVLPLTRSRWSVWYVALVPEADDDNSAYEQHDNEGFIFKEILEDRFLEGYDNGIYELGVSRGSERISVVYIGAAHRRGPGSLNQRIVEHCRGGSNLDELINRAMSLGYKLSVRAKNIPGSREHVYECEDRYLAKYDYAWNQRNNGHIRGNFPPQ